MASYEKEVALPDDFVQLVSGTPSTTYECSARCRGLLIGVGGTINVTMRNGETRSGIPVQAGIIPGRFASVLTGGTVQNVWEIN